MLWFQRVVSCKFTIPEVSKSEAKYSTEKAIHLSRHEASQFSLSTFNADKSPNASSIKIFYFENQKKVYSKPVVFKIFSCKNSVKSI